jgi:hypothetical protein
MPYMVVTFPPCRVCPGKCYDRCEDEDDTAYGFFRYELTDTKRFYRFVTHVSGFISLCKYNNCSGIKFHGLGAFPAWNIF